MKRRADGHKTGAEIFAVALCLILLGFFVSEKEGFHMDELISFEMANARFNPWIVPTQPEGRLAKFVRNEIDGDSLGETLSSLAATVEDVIRHRGNSRLLTYKADVYEEPVWITGEQFRDYITVGKKDAFQYLSVYFNVKDDNHPPLHFMLLHTVSSIFRGKACPWMGCAVNLAAAAAVLVLLIKLGRMLAETLGMEEYSRFAGLLCALLYGVSSGAVATVLLIRMYAMLALWCLAFLYLMLKKWRGRSFDRHNKGLIAVTLMGFWTQYFFLFYCIILAAAVGALLLLSKRVREFGYMLRSFVIAAVIGLALFPFAITDVFASGRGVEALGNLSQGFNGYGERLAAFAGIFWERTLSPGFWLLLAAGAAACLARRLARRLGRKAEACAEAGAGAAGEESAEAGAGTAGMASAEKAAGRGAYMVFVLLPMAGYFLLAARMSPYLVDRYIMPLFPLAALAGGLLLVYVLRALTKGGGDSGGNVCKWCACGVCVLVVLLQAGTLAGYDGEYLYSGYRAQEDAAASHEGEACICVYDGVGYYENLKEFTYYDKTLLLTVRELENRQDTDSIEELGRFVLLVKGGLGADAVLDVFAAKYGFVPQERILAADSVYGDSLFVMMPAAGASAAGGQ